MGGGHPPKENKSLGGVFYAPLGCRKNLRPYCERGYLKGKSAVRIHRELLKTKGTLFGRTFWARGYCVSTVGLDEHRIRQYIQEQEKLQQGEEQGDWRRRR
ncbi:MAG: transposase [Phycisphaerae bacterium]